MKERKLLIAVRAGLLAIVDGIEDYLNMQRTKDLRKIAREIRIQDNVTHSGDWEGEDE